MWNADDDGWNVWLPGNNNNNMYTITIQVWVHTVQKSAFKSHNNVNKLYTWLNYKFDLKNSLLKL